VFLIKRQLLAKEQQLAFIQRLRRKMVDIKAAQEGRENISTPRETSVLLEHLSRGRILEPRITQDFFDPLHPENATTNAASLLTRGASTKAESGAIQVSHHNGVSPFPK
jgi:hypothetical protein